MILAAKEKEVTYDVFLDAVNEDKIEKVDISSTIISYRMKDDPKELLYYTAVIPEMNLEQTVQALYANDVEFKALPPQEENSSFFLSWIVLPILMYVLFYFILRFASKRSGGGIGGLGSIGKSKAKVYMEKETGVTFRDVAGQDEAKESLVEIIDFLHNPKKYTAIGAKLPKGALLVGSPGTGKTLLAKAVAGEAHVPFFSISGSDFVEMFVGVGASRVRDLFQEAAKVAPAIIFIDEIDAIGRSRDSRFGGNDEREQTLNQLLAEIDGFDSSKGVVILAATNRPEVLDKALLRAGRFDRRIIVDRPNLEGRYQTLLVHTRNIRLSEDVDLRKLAQATAGAVGADLANLVNEAALRAVRMGRKAVNHQDLLVSFETVIAGTEKKGTVLTDIEKRIVAYHEVGHALVAALRKHTQPVSKITIVPHTSGALGYTMQMPEEEKYLNSKQELMIQLQTLLGGRAAEQTVFGIQTSGAANDIQRATELAKKMVMQLGMSEKLGLMAVATQNNEYLDGQSYMDCSQATAALADEEVKSLLNECYEQAKQLLTEKRALLDEIALYLLQKETITGDELMTYVRAEREETQ
ncbi:MAG: ATP-dependent zinc metalloprotease FtsH [Ruminococcaceae bacterium]|nr:ATP-dependent zinc metalloprotease FtsH [Oscillospiraceae bacterium]